MWSRLNARRTFNPGIFDLRNLKPPARNARLVPRRSGGRRSQKNPEPEVEHDSEQIELQQFFRSMDPKQRALIKGSIERGEIKTPDLLKKIRSLRDGDDVDDSIAATYEVGVHLIKLYLQYSDVLENPRKHHKNLWKMVEHLGDMQAETKDQIPFDIFTKLFEVAKLQPKPTIRPKCVKMMGDIIYSYGLVRMDPFNEVEYMDALCELGNVFKAIELWKSRKNKVDVKDSIYWLEVGALYYQQARNFNISEELALEMSDKFDGYIPPRVILGFLQAYAHLRQTEKLDFWYSKLKEMLEKSGLELSEKKAPEEMQNLNQQQAKSLFNERKKVKASELQGLVRIFLDSRCWEYAAGLIDDMKKLGIDISLDSVLATLDATTRRMVEYEPAAYTGKRHDRLPPTESNKKLTVVISKLVAQYPEILDNPKFYESWLRGLAGLELYRNALMVVDAMIKRNISPSSTHMHTLIKALLAKKQLEMASDLLGRMENQQPGTLYPPVSSNIYALFIQYGARRSDSEYVKEILKRMNEHGCEQSQSTFNTLMFYYYRHKEFNRIFDLYNTTLKQHGFAFFDHINYRTLWLVCRDYFRSPQLYSRKNQTSPPDLRLFFAAMIHSPKFKLSLNVYEYALHAFMLSKDFEATSAVLCHLEAVNNIKIQAPLIASVLQLAAKITSDRKFAFTRPTKKDLLVEPGYSDPTAVSVPWYDVVTKMGQVLEMNEEESKNLINQGSRLCNEMNRENPLSTA